MSARKRWMKPRPWRLADALVKLRDQVNQVAPKRGKALDGSIGDDAHRRKGSASDHNPWVDDPRDPKRGVVTALDITHDPANGCDVEQLAEAIRAARDPRVKYMIFRGRIVGPDPRGDVEAWEWRPYGGRHPHDKHLHISVSSNPLRFDNASDWAWPWWPPARTGKSAGVIPSAESPVVAALPGVLADVRPAPAAPPVLDRDPAPGVQERTLRTGGGS